MGEQLECQEERRPYGGQRLAGRDMGLVGPLVRHHAVVLPPEQEGCGAEPVEVVAGQVTG